MFPGWKKASALVDFPDDPTVALREGHFVIEDQPAFRAGFVGGGVEADVPALLKELRLGEVGFPQPLALLHQALVFPVLADLAERLAIFVGNQELAGEQAITAFFGQGQTLFDAAAMPLVHVLLLGVLLLLPHLAEERTGGIVGVGDRAADEAGLVARQLVPGMNHRGEAFQGEGVVLGPAFQRFPAVGAAVRLRQQPDVLDVHHQRLPANSGPSGRPSAAWTDAPRLPGA